MARVSDNVLPSGDPGGHWGGVGSSKEAPVRPLVAVAAVLGSRAALKDIPIGIRTLVTLYGTRPGHTRDTLMLGARYFVQQLLIIRQRYIGIEFHCLEKDCN